MGTTDRRSNEHRRGTPLAADQPAEATFEESKRQGQSLREDPPDYILTLDSDLNITFASRAPLEFGAKELIGTSILTYVDEDKRPETEITLRGVLETWRPACYDTTNCTADGSVVHYETHAAPQISGTRVTGLVLVARDITQGKRAEELLERERQRLFAVLDIVPGFVYLQARDYTIPFANARFCDTFGAPGSRPCYEVIHGRCNPCKECPTFRVFETNASQVWEWTSADSRTFAIYDEPFPELGEDESMVLEIAIDITDRKQAEAKLLAVERMQVETEKLAATGRLAARVAHEINNPLAGIKNSFLLIKDAVPADHPDHDMVERIEREIDRIAGIVRQMYALHSPQADVPIHQSFHETIRDVLVMLDPLQRDQNVGIKLEPVPNEIMLWIPKGNFHQILYNLLANAVEASTPGGNVVVAAWHGDNDDAVIEVRDRGCGIPADVQDEIFEPFFSTKDDGSANVGMGLGLSIVKSIVETSGGAIDFESKVACGTTFRVRLPVHRKA